MYIHFGAGTIISLKHNRKILARFSLQNQLFCVCRLPLPAVSTWQIFHAQSGPINNHISLRKAMHRDLTGHDGGGFGLPLKIGETFILDWLKVNRRRSITSGTHTAVHASLNTGDCYKFHGGIHTLNGYTFYQLQNVHGENLWVAGNYLNTATSGHCTTTHSTGTTCSDAVAKDYACKILALHNAGKIHLWNKHPSGEHDNAYAYNNINDACHGHAASRSHYTCGECRNPGAPGGHVCLSRKLLQYIHDIGSSGYIHVNEIAGACHSCHSRHYNGKAVDLDNGRNSLFLSKCREYGGVEPLNEGNHIHCGFA